MALPVYATLALLGLVLAAAAAIANRFRLPPALGYLLVGLAASPAQAGAGLLPAATAQHASELAIVLVLFFIGLELELPKLHAILRKTAGTAFIELSVTAAAVTGLLLLLRWSPVHAAAGGLAASASSTIFGDRLSAGRAFPKIARERILGTLLAEDIGSVLLLTGMVLLGGQGHTATQLASSIGTVLIVLVVLAGAAILIVPRALDAAARTHVHELVVLTSLGFLLLCAYVGFLIGAPELGALLAGVAAAEAGSRYVVRNALAAVREIALAIFLFVSALLVDLQAFTPAVFGVGVAVAAMVALGKIGLNGAAALAAGTGTANALRVGLGLATLGEFSLVLVVVAEERAVAHPALRNAIVCAVVLLLLASSIGMKLVGRLRLPDPQPWMQRPSGAPAPHLRNQRPPLWPPIRRLASSAILLVGWLGVCLRLLAPYLEARLPNSLATAIAVAVAGLGAAVFGYGVYRGYRRLGIAILGVEAKSEAGSTRLRIIDAWVAGGLAILLVPMAFLFPASWPAALAGVLVAMLVAAAAWRRLRRVHDALAQSMERVLGREVDAHLLEDAFHRHSLAVEVAAVAVPGDSPISGTTLGKSRLSELTGCTVAVLQRGGADIVAPRSMQSIQAGDVLVLLGDAAQLRRAEALIVAHGDAIRLTASGRSVDTLEVTVPPASRWIGAPLAALDLKHRCGALVLGMRRAGDLRAAPFRGSFVVQEGDRIILLGTDLQLTRAREELRGDRERLP